MNILITGGSTGLGRALVKACAEMNNQQVLFTYCSHEDEALELTGRYANVKAVKTDFTDEADINRLVKQIGETTIDVLINNAYAGSPSGTHFHKTEPDDFTQAFLWNVIPVIKLTQACVIGMRKQKFGKIINIITSYVIDVPPTGMSVYTATKAYIRQLSKSWCKELGRFNITSNCILPDFMQTGFGEVDDRILEQMRDAHPLKTLLKPEEVAEVVCHIIQSSQQLNGVEIPVNAAQHIL